jgi:hypothetical protein
MMMKFHSPFLLSRPAARAVLFLALGGVAATSGVAGEFFGSIKAEGKAAPKGVKIEIVSPDSTFTAETDNYGSYRLYVPAKGKCQLKVHYKGQTPSIQVFSYPKSTRYDFSVEKKDTTFLLKRK